MSIAESQFYETDLSRYEGEQECGGLASFVILKEWLAAKIFMTEATVAAVKELSCAAMPVLETNIFRANDGTFIEYDPEGDPFSVSATALILKEYNTPYIV